MVINMENMHKFFNVADFRKLLKIVRLDWEHRDEHMEKLKNYLQWRIKDCESSKNRCQEYAEKEIAAMKMYSTGKLPDGTPIADEGLTRLRQSISEYRIKQKEFSRDEKENARIVKKLTKYLSAIK